MPHKQSTVQLKVTLAIATSMQVFLSELVQSGFRLHS